MTLRPENASTVDLRDKLVLWETRLHELKDSLVHRLDNSGCTSEIDQLLLGFHRSLPIHQAGGVPESRVRQVALKQLETGS